MTLPPVEALAEFPPLSARTGFICDIVLVARLEHQIRLCLVLGRVHEGYAPHADHLRGAILKYERRVLVDNGSHRPRVRHQVLERLLPRHIAARRISVRQDGQVRENAEPLDDNPPRVGRPPKRETANRDRARRIARNHAATSEQRP